MLSKRAKTARLGVAFLGVAAVAGASILPGGLATAEETGDVQSTVTRAVLATGNANGEINRATLVTQINLDGNGTAQFTVPVAEGSSPKNMDSFGGPEVVDGSAQYDLTVDGPQTFRTSQNFDPAEIPVTVKVEATLDGQPVAPADLAGQTGLAKLKYTFTNTTSEPTQITYKDAKGQRITVEKEIPVAMGASLVFAFDESWQEISAPTADAVLGNGTGATQVQGAVALLPDALPGQSPTGSFEVEGRITNGVVPPADIKVALLSPADFPALNSKIKDVEQLSETTATITDAGMQLEEGAGQLEEGLKTASDGANKINDGVQGQLGPGVAQLSEGLTTFNDVAISTLQESAAGLPQQVTSSPDFAQITDGFGALRDATDGLRKKLGEWTPAVKTSSSQKPGPYLKANGDVDKGSKATVARVLWALAYGGRSQDVPNDSPTKNFKVPNGGLTNPDCDVVNAPEAKNNPCGAFQVLAYISEQLQDALLPNLEALLVTLPTTIADGLTGAGALGVNTLAGSLGCVTTQKTDPGAKPGQTGPIVQNCPKDIVVGDAVDNGDGTWTVTGTNAKGATNLVLPLLSATFFNPLKLDGKTPDPSSGIAALLGQFMPTAYNLPNAGVKAGVEGAIEGIDKLNGVITTDPNGNPDKDTSKKNTATGIIMQVRAQLAQGGIGGDGYPAGRCEGYKKTGDPSSGLNTNANSKRVEATCAAGDVMQIAVYGVDALEEGVSVTLLESISEQLLAGVGTYSAGCDPTATLACAAGTLAAGGVQLNEGVNGPGESLSYGINALAEGLPAAVEGAGKIVDAGVQLGDSGNDGSKQANEALAVFEALQTRADSGTAIPGGAPEGVDVANGVYAFAFDGAGGTATENAARAGLGFLGLIAAGGLGALLANRAGG